MSSRWLRISMLLYMCLWFGVIVPGHTRGLIRLSSNRAGADAPSCCPFCPACAAAGHADPANHHPRSSDPCEDCAICNMAARLEMPTVIHLDLPFVGLLHVLPVLPIHTLAGTEFVPDCRGRGPPTIV